VSMARWALEITLVDITGVHGLEDCEDKISGCDLITLDMSGFSVSLRPEVSFAFCLNANQPKRNSHLQIQIQSHPNFGPARYAHGRRLMPACALFATPRGLTRQNNGPLDLHRMDQEFVIFPRSVLRAQALSRECSVRASARAYGKRERCLGGLYAQDCKDVCLSLECFSFLNAYPSTVPLQRPTPVVTVIS
jgi:hypothetical protein